MLIYDSHQTEDQEDVFFWATQMHALTPPSAAVCGSHGAGPRRPGLATIDAMIATWLRTMETMDTMHTMDSKTKPRQSIFCGIFFFELLNCFHSVSQPVFVIAALLKVQHQIGKLGRLATGCLSLQENLGKECLPFHQPPRGALVES